MPVEVQKAGYYCMDTPSANVLWLQNNNNTPQRQQNPLRPGQNGRPNGQPPQGGGSSMLNRWLLIIVLVMLGIYAYSFFNPANNSTASQRDTLTYNAFYDQINAGNIKTAIFDGQTDITGDFRQPLGQYKQYYVVQLPN